MISKKAANSRYDKQGQRPAKDFFIPGDYVMVIHGDQGPFSDGSVHKVTLIECWSQCVEVAGGLRCHASRLALCDPEGNIIEDFFV